MLAHTQLDNEALEQIDTDDLEEMDLKCFQLKQEPTYFTLMALLSLGSSSSSSSDSETLSFARLDDYVYKTNASETITSVPRNESTTSKSSKDNLEQHKDVRPSAPI
ncbi:hypothetical protein Tco_0151187 [Tanacetum coccineum]